MDVATTIELSRDLSPQPRTCQRIPRKVLPHGLHLRLRGAWIVEREKPGVLGFNAALQLFPPLQQQLVFAGNPKRDRIARAFRSLR